MPRFAHLIRLSLLAMLWMAVVPACAIAAETNQVNPRQTWQMLDYIAVDYAGAVQAGRVADVGEYEEMREFAAAVQTQLAAMSATDQQPVLMAQADRLVAAVEAKAEPMQVAALARGLADELLVSYPIGAVPISPPEPAQAAALYTQRRPAHTLRTI